jgi:hypothetical protein
MLWIAVRRARIVTLGIQLSQSLSPFFAHVAAAWRITPSRA